MLLVVMWMVAVVVECRMESEVDDGCGCGVQDEE